MLSYTVISIVFDLSELRQTDSINKIVAQSEWTELTKVHAHVHYY